MPVLAGLAIPKTAPNPSGAKQLIKWLNSVSGAGEDARLGRLLPGRRLEAVEAARGRPPEHEHGGQEHAAGQGRLKSLLPIGLGAEGGNFNKVYVDTFTRIVVKGEDPKSVVNDEAPILQAIMDKTGAKCWAPDPPSKGPCHVK